MKRGKGRPGKADKEIAGNEAPQPKLDATVMLEAEGLGYAGRLQNLASRPEVMARRYPARALLEALKRSGGLVNPAKHSLLGD